MSPADHQQLAQHIKQWGKALGFADVGITHADLSAFEAGYFNWLGENFHGEMAYMAAHGTKRTRPAELVPGTVSLISVRLNYLDLDAANPLTQLHQADKAYISRYALGKDYHKLMRKRLQALAEKIQTLVPDFSYRAFCDSAPVLERPIAQQAGLGFTGKNSLIIHPRAGSWFFLGELYTNLALPADAPFEKQGCGPCRACIVECPTGAIVGNGVVDARKCISYLTIEYKGAIPPELRPQMGNRIYGCDDCQLVCPWNKFTHATQENAFTPKHDLDRADLLTLWQWNETDFMKRLEGSPIRRIGFAQWKRNLAVALGNMRGDNAKLQAAIEALEKETGQISPLVDEHIDWAISQLRERLKTDALQTPENPLEKLNRPGMSDTKPFYAKRYYLPKPSDA
ncbi:tRNA epoxyqueuosine(34) reductase QueG [Thiomicrorhabdus cannonii]|uniref:tRNA epoxyqueuosine(34) reductase QueG n=1 Tax=Thiomicrorhabdus cannonii TaxID=2748011 RepID=UPI0015B85635|nr:tRNA epoxyqueuosine(34) reductase QueG [Thiomicrorhabdus cannonii]